MNVTVKKTIAWLLVYVLSFILGSCAPGENPSSPESLPGEPSSQDVSTGSALGVLNPLTGLSGFDQSKMGLRPVGIMINNIKDATPANNITNADLCYEMVAEGGITRILAMYADYSKIAMTGSIRSVRPYYLYLAQGHDAFLVHIGGSEDAYSYIRNNKFNDVDGMYDSKNLWRDPGRKARFGSLHSVVTDGEHLTAAIKAKKYRTEINADVKQFSFNKPDQPVIPAGEVCEKLTVPFSEYCVATFNYDAQTKLYYKSQFKKPQLDAVDDKTQVAVTNVVVMYSKVTHSGDAKGHMDVGLSSGSGMYASGGKMIPVKWSKGKPSDPLIFADESGAVLNLNAGKTWICIIDKSMKITAA